MDSNKIEDLLNKYWNCESTLEEEQQLREYFKGHNIPEQLRETASLFRYFEENKKKDLHDASFDKKILEHVKGPKKKTVTRLLYNSMRIAAGIAVLVVATWLVRNEIRKSTPQQATDTYNDPKMALEETKKALLMISKSFGKAEEKAKKITLFNETQQKIQQEETKTQL
jgi:hypothetical protein